MERATVREKLIEILQKYSREKELFENVKDESEIVKDLKVNSARIVDFVLDLEDLYGIEVDSDGIDRMFTVGETLEVIMEEIKKQKNG